MHTRSLSVYRALIAALLALVMILMPVVSFAAEDADTVGDADIVEDTPAVADADITEDSTAAADQAGPTGTYKLKVKVTDAGNNNYKAGTRTITVTIKVK